MIRRRKRLLLVALWPVVVAAATPRGDWLAKVPETARTHANPLPDNQATIASGQQLYLEHCASCHGQRASGRGHRPSLRTDRVRQATDGELQWLLRNGSLRYGMPAWSNLPEGQRWQIVRYLHSLPVDDRALKP